MKLLGLVLAISLLILAGGSKAHPAKPQATDEPLRIAGEKHLRNIKQLTFGGENAEAYFSADDRQLIFQSKLDGRQCDQIYTMNVDGSHVKMISTGDGRTTCSYFFPTGKRVLYSSTHLGSKE